MLVLVADDDPTTCALVAAIIKQAGHEVVIARDAMQVMWMVKNHKLHAVVLDLQMPAGGGVSALQRLKSSVLTNDLPVIVLSGVTDEATIRRVQSLGVEFLPKPADPETLMAALNRATATPS